MRQEVLRQLHESHLGSVRTKQRSKLTTGIDNDIENTILACKTCQDSLPSKPREPLSQKAKPTRPFQAIAADFCTYIRSTRLPYIILVDRYSDWPDIIPMGHNTTTPRLNAVLRQSFCRTGVPDILWSDQGPQFIAKLFQEFAKKWGFKHLTSSPLYPQSNGRAEATVKSMKKLIRAAWTGRSLDEGTLTRALLQY